MRVELASLADFKLGPLLVRPPRCQILLPDGAVRDLEPRVMKVLVALAEARSEVVSRDRLVERCWDGRIVGDNAVNRCIAVLRNLSRGLDPPAFAIETFPRVGYSLVETGDQDVTASGEGETEKEGFAPIGRRLALAGLGAAGLLAVAGAGYWSLGSGAGSSGNEAAQEWYRRGVQTREQGLAELFPQVQAYFRQAVEADPEFAEGWSALALAYAAPVFFEGGDAQAGLAQHARAAAEQALRLDPDSLEARAALAFIPSEFGRWAEAQTELRALIAARPDSDYLNWVLHSRLAHSLSECGRCAVALAAARATAALKPLHPGSMVNLVTTLWLAGALEEADRVSEQAAARWPSHAGLWLTRLAFLTYSGRAPSAVAMATAGGRPSSVERHNVLDRRLATAQALATGASADIDQAVRLYDAHMTAYPDEMMPAARFFAALGRVDTALDVVEAYFLNTGPRAVAGRPARNALTRYDATSLFWPPMAPTWSAPRFEALTGQIGLARYWRETGTVPDFRLSRR